MGRGAMPPPTVGGPTQSNGADTGGRTRTALRPRDFKSLASTSFAMSAAGLAPGERNSRPGRAGQRFRRLPAPARRPPRNDGLKGRRNNLVIARSDSDVAIHPSARSTPTMDCRVGPAGLLAMTAEILQKKPRHREERQRRGDPSISPLCAHHGLPRRPCGPPRNDEVYSAKPRWDRRPNGRRRLFGVPKQKSAREGGNSVRPHSTHTSSGNGTMVDFTVFIAMASATAAFSPSSEKG